MVLTNSQQMKKNNINTKVCLLTITIIFSLLTTSCLNLRPCNKDIVGRYFCQNIEGATNSLVIKGDGTYLQSYKQGNIELSNSGTWKKSDDGYCAIRLKKWKNFNEFGENYENFGSSLLFINGDYLDIGPDGDSDTSFKKE